MIDLLLLIKRLVLIIRGEGEGGRGGEARGGGGRGPRVPPLNPPLLLLTSFNKI